jgi:hypothetical protein
MYCNCTEVFENCWGSEEFYPTSQKETKEDTKKGDRNLKIRIERRNENKTRNSGKN